MEILAPAGSIEQGYSAIEAGCDAIYGGLKIGNARQRAKNFTSNEYSQILNYCKSKNVKFYLTLNTLLRSDELTEMLDIIKSIELPDAVIVADIGLIHALLETFPSLPIHASTQFGTASLNDVLFLESIGVTRAVLSRELTFDEIKYIKENSHIELEVFVFGTQCALFSGQCLWGGLICESSGNRGKCNGMCRDFYKCSNLIGQFFYPKDMEIGKHIERLDKIGICSAKIEGRLRPVAEIEKVIKTIRSGYLIEGYSSYLSNKLPVKGMFHSVNPRVRFSGEFSEYYTEHDLLYRNGRYVYGDQTDDYADSSYVKTVYNKPLADGANISLKLKYDETVLNTISYVNAFGEKKLIPLEHRDTTFIEVKQLCELLQKHIHKNIYELISEVPDAVTIQVDPDEILKVCNYINEECNQEYSAVVADNTLKADSSLLIQTDKVQDIIEFSNKGYNHFVFEINSEREFELALELTQEIVFRLPILDFNQQLENIVNRLENRKIMMTKSTQLLILKKHNFQKVIADYTMNCWNEQSLIFLKKYGVKEITIHPELELGYSLDLIWKAGLVPQVIIAGKIPIGFMRGCFKELNICDQKCDGNIDMRNINKCYDLEIDCNSYLEYRTVYRGGIDMTYSDKGKFKKRILISKITEELKMDILNMSSVFIEKPNYLYRRNVK